MLEAEKTFDGIPYQLKQYAEREGLPRPFCFSFDLFDSSRGMDMVRSINKWADENIGYSTAIMITPSNPYNPSRIFISLRYRSDALLLKLTFS